MEQTVTIHQQRRFLLQPIIGSVSFRNARGGEVRTDQAHTIFSTARVRVPK